MPENTPEFFSKLSLGLQLGFSLTAPLVIFIAGGVWLDKTFRTAPLFVLLGVFLGLSTSFYILYRDILPMLSKKPDRPRK